MYDHIQDERISSESIHGCASTASPAVADDGFGTSDGNSSFTPSNAASKSIIERAFRSLMFNTWPNRLYGPQTGTAGLAYTLTHSNLDVGVRLLLYSGRFHMSEEPTLQIGEVAERTGVTQRTLRFYEEKGLLKPPSRMDGGFRLYSEEDVKRVQKIRRLQELLGTSLAEIKEMVDAETVLRELRAQYNPEAELAEKRRQLEKAIEVTHAQHAIVKQKTKQMREMELQLEERLKLFDRWMTELEQLEKETSAPLG
jgi:Predicted transcriptional regulators